MRHLSSSLIGSLVASILLTGLVVPHDAFAEAKIKTITKNFDDCSKCGSGDVDKKADPDRKGHKVIKKPVKKEPPKKEPPKKEPPKKTPVKKDPPKKVAPKAPVKKK